jgi:pimeloyl-ACP methyl ester carboxylesterase
MNVMAPLPAGTAEHLIDLGTGVTLRVLRRGAGPALVMAPGWTCSADFFAHQLAGLADTHDVIAYDPRGHGGSSKPLTGNNFAQRGRDLGALLDALQLDRAILLGWSFGVYDVLSYIRDHGTARVAGVVLCDETPTCPADPNDPDAWGEAPLSMDGIVQFLRLAIDARTEFWTAYAKDMVGLPEDTADDHPDVTRIVELGLQTPEHIAIATMADGVATDLADAARATAAAVPTLFIAKEAWADQAKRWIGANLPTASFATMPFHMGFVTHPDGFNATVAGFTGSLS